MNTPAKKLAVAQLRAAAAALVASTNGTELTDAQLKNFRTGILILVIMSIDATTGDEVYTFTLKGRELAADALEDLAEIELSAVAGTAVAGTYYASVDRFRSRLRLDLDVGASTTPSVAFTAVAVATEVGYAPTVAAAIVA